jgi:hypothetical protein
MSSRGSGDGTVDEDGKEIAPMAPISEVEEVVDVVVVGVGVPLLSPLIPVITISVGGTTESCTVFFVALPSLFLLLLLVDGEVLLGVDDMVACLFSFSF